MDDKRTAIDLSLLRDEFQATNGKIRWIDTRYMLADPLTKECSPEYLRYVMRTGKWSILEEGNALQKKLLERQKSLEDEPELIVCGIIRTLFHLDRLTSNPVERICLT